VETPYKQLSFDERRIEMRHVVMLSVLVVVLLAGCEYDAPLTTEHSIAVDSSVVDLWEIVGRDLKTTDELREAFLKHKDNKDLFKDSLVFRRIEK
jgi:hypothetical protein